MLLRTAGLLAHASRCLALPVLKTVAMQDQPTFTVAGQRLTFTGFPFKQRR